MLKIDPSATISSLQPQQVLRDSSSNSLHKACRMGDVNWVKKLLFEGAEIDQTDFNGRTPLQIATESGHADVVRVLIDRKANLFVTTGGGRSLLSLARASHSPQCLSIVSDAMRNSSEGRQRNEMSNLFGLKDTPDSLYEGYPNSIYTESLSHFLFRNHSHPLSILRRHHQVSGDLHRVFSEFLSSGNHGNIIPTEARLLLAYAFDRSFCSPRIDDSSETVQRVARGELVYMPTGSRSHAVAICFFKTHMAICNCGSRGEAGKNASSIEIFRIDPKKMTLPLCTNLLWDCNSHSTDDVSHFLYHELPKKLSPREGVILQDDVSNVFKQSAIAPKNQPTGNCAATSAAAALYLGQVILTYSAEKKKSPWDFTSLFQCAQKVKPLHDEVMYKMKLDAFNKYTQNHSTDESNKNKDGYLVKECSKQLAMLSKNPQNKANPEQREEKQ